MKIKWNRPLTKIYPWWNFQKDISGFSVIAKCHFWPFCDLDLDLSPNHSQKLMESSLEQDLPMVKFSERSIQKERSGSKIRIRIRIIMTIKWSCPLTKIYPWWNFQKDQSRKKDPDPESGSGSGSSWKLNGVVPWPRSTPGEIFIKIHLVVSEKSCPQTDGERSGSRIRIRIWIIMKIKWSCPLTKTYPW